jgi:putative FmdB family regulatory protein
VLIEIQNGYPRGNHIVFAAGLSLEGPEDSCENRLKSLSRLLLKEAEMPIYEYKCTECNECFEVKQSFSDKNTAVCQACGGEAKRVFVPVPIVFKGSGFYITDHAHKDKSSAVKDMTESFEKAKAVKDIEKPSEKPAEKPVDSKN